MIPPASVSRIQAVARSCARPLRGERGGVILFVAISLVVILGMSALAVDLGMLYTARSEAQRTADAAALAGASAFLEMPASVASGPAQTRAYDYARQNFIRNTAVTDADVESVVVTPNQQRVSVTIRRQQIGLWFARVLGFGQASVAARATAEAVQGGSAQCLRPWALPDMWHDNANDANNNRIWDSNEQWNFDNANSQTYKQFSASDPPNLSETGYASGYRNGYADENHRTYDADFGRQLVIKATDPKDTPTSGFFYPWRVGDAGQGAQYYEDNIKLCNTTTVNLGQEYELEMGDMRGPTYQGVVGRNRNDADALMNQDPGARWDPNANQGKGGVTGVDPKYGSWENSPRVIKVAVFDPTLVKTIKGNDGSPGQKIKFNNFALLFLEGQADQNAPVTARFLYYVTGSGGTGPVNGSLVRVLRLVE